jgi:hypothetical protein
MPYGIAKETRIVALRSTKIDSITRLNIKSHNIPMASYATIVSMPPASAVEAKSSIASPSYNRGTLTDVQQNIMSILAALQGVTTTPEALVATVNSLRGDMEGAPAPPVQQGMRTGAVSQNRFANTQFTKDTRSFQNSSWRSGFQQETKHTQRYPQKVTSAFDTRAPPSATSPKANVGRYQSRFKTEGDMNDKILNTVIGNKLNSFTKLTYNDTRDFIYQIMDSGETEFIKDFIEKVFSKATVEELYCALFAKLIAEIAHRYPIMYEEMKRYHSEFLKVFENVQEEGGTSDSNTVAKQRQYRLGYGQFISELAGQNALEKEQLLAMVSKVMDNIWIISSQAEKVNVVEECVDCLVRLTKSLMEKSPKFFKDVKGEMGARILERITALVTKNAGDRPSLTPKARFGLMDLKDIL